MKANLEELSGVFGISRRTIAEWTRRGCPGTRGECGWMFDTAEVYRWLRKRDLAEARKNDPDAALRTRRLRATVAQAELSNKQRAGELVDSAGVIAGYEELVVEVRDRFRTIGSELRDNLARTSEPAKCQELVDLRIREILAHMAAWRPIGKATKKKSRRGSK